VNKTKIWIDGSGAQFEGQKAKALVLYEDGIKEYIEINQRKTNNEMEYQALYTALINDKSINAEIFTDSQLLVGHLTKGWKVKAENLKGAFEMCSNLLSLKKAKLVWIPREENKAGISLEKEEIPIQDGGGLTKFTECLKEELEALLQSKDSELESLKKEVRI
jgi:ribonuclease HI